MRIRKEFQTQIGKGAHLVSNTQEHAFVVPTKIARLKGGFFRTQNPLK